MLFRSDVFIGHIWPTADEVKALMKFAMDAPTFRRLYADLANSSALWKKIPAPAGQVYSWPKSTYIAEPPFFAGFAMQPGGKGDIRGVIAPEERLPWPQTAAMGVQSRVSLVVASK